MIACHDETLPSCRIEAPVLESPDGEAASDEPCPRTVEILTVLNDVFDTLCPSTESGILKVAVSA
ncbi:MAG TPA: hypothetical protein VF170_02660 [Planctomycetaceae bacterium]